MKNVNVSALSSIHPTSGAEFHAFEADDAPGKHIRAEHRRLRTPLWRYLLHSRIFVALSSPFIYACIFPFALLDLFISVYQIVCFPVYGIPRAGRRDYLIFDRGKLGYLNAAEKINCVYCSYANGLIAYAGEIAARTEQHWCPIKHGTALSAPHSQCKRFLPYGDAPAYRQQLEDVRRDYKDLTPQETRPTGDSPCK